jgi:hypothetical protein
MCGQLRITRKPDCVPEVFSEGLVFSERVKLGNPNSSNLNIEKKKYFEDIGQLNIQ